MEDSRIEINMFGTGFETLNPDNRLVFKRPNTRMQDNQSSRSAPGKITFDIRKGNHVRQRDKKIISKNFILSFFFCLKINFKQRMDADDYDQYENNNYINSARS
jgi:hypothetical protein